MTEIRPKIVRQEPTKETPKQIITDFDFDDIPEQIKMPMHLIEGFDNVVKEIHHVPKKWRNIWVKIGYRYEPVPLLWDPGGHPYINAPSRKKVGVRVKVMIKMQYAEEILDLLEVATDFCDYCTMPLPTHEAGAWLEYSSGGGTIADIKECSFCEKENIRWDKEFIDEHPELKGLKLR